jgi:hypothetical protein
VQSPCPCSLFERGIEREKKKKKKKKASTKESKSLLLHVGAIAFANNAMPLCLFHHQPADILPPKRVFFFSMQWKSLANVHTPPNAKKKLLIWPQKSEKKLDRKKKKKKKKKYFVFCLVCSFWRRKCLQQITDSHNSDQSVSVSDKHTMTLNCQKLSDGDSNRAVQRNVHRRRSIHQIFVANFVHVMLNRLKQTRKVLKKERNR